VNNENLSGGWYDSGAHTKFAFPAAWTITTLAWGYLDARDNWDASGLAERLKTELRWGLDHILQCHEFDSNSGPEARTTRLYVQVGLTSNDNSQWTRPEQMTWGRPASYVDWTNPGTDVAAEMSAALAAGFLVFVDEDPAYATELVVNAATLYRFAHTNPTKRQYQNTVRDAGSSYPSSGYIDELAWAAMWMHRAQGGVYNYLNDAEIYYSQLNTDGSYPIYRAFNWDDKTAGVSLLLARETNQTVYKDAIRKYLMEWMRPEVRTSSSAGDVQYTDYGLAYRTKGLQWLYPLLYSGSAAFLALVYRDDMYSSGETSDPMYSDLENFARDQLRYILGDNNKGQSYQVRFSGSGPRYAHSRTASCDPVVGAECSWANYDSTSPNPTRLVGAVVGGPYDDDVWYDQRNDFERNGVSLANNAAFTAATLRMQYIPRVCTGFNEDPWYNGYTDCCNGLKPTLGDWGGNPVPYYLCKP
jgi:hypothetical protein